MTPDRFSEQWVPTNRETCCACFSLFLVVSQGEEDTCTGVDLNSWGSCELSAATASFCCEPGHDVDVASFSVSVGPAAQCCKKAQACLVCAVSFTRSDVTLWWPFSFARFCRAGSKLSWCLDEVTASVPVRRNTWGFRLVGWEGSGTHSLCRSRKQFSTTRDIY